MRPETHSHLPDHVRALVLAALPHASVIFVDRALVVRLATGSALAAHRYDPDAMLGRSLADVLPAAAYERLAPAYQQALGGSPASFEHHSHDGAAWYQVDITPVHDAAGDVIGALAIAVDITARKTAELRAADRTKLLEDVLDSLGEPVTVLDAEGRVMLLNRECEAIVGIGRDEVRGTHASELHPCLGSRMAEEVLRRREAVEEERVLPVQGGERTFKLTHSPLSSEDGEVYGVCTLATDLTDRKAMEEELRRATERFETAFSEAPIGMALVEPDGRLLRVNTALLDLLGYGPEETRALTVERVLHPDDRAKNDRLVRRLLDGEITAYSVEQRQVTKTGEAIWTLTSGSLVRDGSGRPLHFIAQVQDISERKLSEERLRDLAERDPLTGLYNRRRFEEELARELDRSRRYGERACLLVMDVDGFKAINDRHGHRVGDAVLRTVGAALKARLRASDTVARIGGDEFAALLVNVEPEMAEKITEELRSSVGSSVVVLGAARVRATVSVGLHTFGGEAGADRDPFELADEALYTAKRSGRNRVETAG